MKRKEGNPCVSDNDSVDFSLWPGLHDIGLLFMLGRFYESDTENAPEGESLHKKLSRIVRAERIRLTRNGVNKTKIQNPKESDT